MKATATIVSSTVRATARTGCRLRAAAWVSSATGHRTYLHVAPDSDQTLQWLTPQAGIDYSIEASSGLSWNIV